jgi:excisionase family DNA binding protein
MAIRKPTSPDSDPLPATPAAMANRASRDSNEFTGAARWTAEVAAAMTNEEQRRFSKLVAALSQAMPVRDSAATAVAAANPGNAIESTSGHDVRRSVEELTLLPRPTEIDTTVSGPALSDGTVLSVAAAATLLGISTSHAYELIKRGDLPALHLGRRVVVPYRGINSLLDAASPRQNGSQR